MFRPFHVARRVAETLLLQVRVVHLWRDKWTALSGPFESGPPRASDPLRAVHLSPGE